MCIVTCTESIACTIFIDEVLNNNNTSKFNATTNLYSINNTSSAALFGGLTAAVVLVLLFLVGVSVFAIAGVKCRAIRQAREKIANRYVCTYIHYFSFVCAPSVYKLLCETPCTLAVMCRDAIEPFSLQM